MSFTLFTVSAPVPSSPSVFPRCRPHNFVFRLYITVLSRPAALSGPQLVGSALAAPQIRSVWVFWQFLASLVCRVDSVNQQVSRDAGDLCGRLYFDYGCLRMNAAPLTDTSRRNMWALNAAQIAPLGLSNQHTDFCWCGFCLCFTRNKQVLPSKLQGDEESDLLSDESHCWDLSFLATI